MRKSIVLFAVIVMFFAGVFAQHEGHQQKGNESVKNEKHEKMMKIHDAHATEMRALELKKERLMLDLKEELMKKSPDWNNVSKIYDKIHDVKNEMWKHKKAQMVEIMKLLTPEQRLKHMNMQDSGNHDRKKSMDCEKKSKTEACDNK